MAGLDGEDRAGGFEVVFVHDLARGTEVGRDANAFEDAGGSDELRDARNAEGVGAFLDRSGTSTCQGCGKEVDVGLLVVGNLLKVLVEGAVEAGLGELLLSEVGQTLTVKGVFKMLEGEGVVEDVGCNLSVFTSCRVLLGFTYHR